MYWIKYNLIFIAILLTQKLIFSEIIQQCQLGTYSNDFLISNQLTNNCPICDQTCQSCYNDSQCTRCKGFRVQDSSSLSHCTQQLNVCPDGYYPNEKELKCDKCSIPFCQTCASSEICNKCVDNFILTTQFSCIYKEFYDTDLKQVIENEKFIIEGSQETTPQIYQIVTSCPYPTIADYVNRVCKKLETCSLIKQNIEFCLQYDIVKLLFTQNQGNQENYIIIISSKEAVLLQAVTMKESSILTQLQQNAFVIQDAFINRGVLHLITTQNILIYNIFTGLLIKQVTINEQQEDYFWINQIQIDDQNMFINQYTISGQDQTKVLLLLYKWEDENKEEGQPYQFSFLKKSTLYKSNQKFLQMMLISDPNNGISYIISSTNTFLLSIKVQIKQLMIKINNSLASINTLEINSYIEFKTISFPVIGYLLSNDLFFQKENNKQIIIVRSTLLISVIIEIDISQMTIVNKQLYTYLDISETLTYTPFQVDQRTQYLIISSQYTFMISIGKINTIFTQNNLAEFDIATNYLIHQNYQSKFESIKWSLIKASDSSNLYLVGYQYPQILLFDLTKNDIQGNIPFKIIMVLNTQGVFSGLSNNSKLIGQESALFYYEKQSIWILSDITSDLKYKFMLNQNLQCQITKEDALFIKDSSIQMIEKFDLTQNLLIQVQYYTQKRSSQNGFSISIINAFTDEIINYLFIPYDLADIISYATIDYTYLIKYAIRDVLVDYENQMICVFFQKDAFLYSYPSLQMIQNLSYQSFVQLYNEFQKYFILLVVNESSQLKYKVYQYVKGQLNPQDQFTYQFDGKVQYTANPYYQTAFLFYQISLIGGITKDRFVTVSNDPNQNNWAIEFYDGQTKLDTYLVIVDSFLEGNFIDENQFVALINLEIRIFKFDLQSGQSLPLIVITSYPNLTNLYSTQKFVKLLQSQKIAVWTYCPNPNLPYSAFSLEIFDLIQGQIVQQITPIDTQGLFIQNANVSINQKKIYIFFEPTYIVKNKQYTYIYQLNSSTRLFELYQNTEQSMEDQQTIDVSQNFDTYYYFQRQQESQDFYFFDSSNNNNRYMFHLKKQINESFIYRSYFISTRIVEQERIKSLHLQVDNKMFSIRRLIDINVDSGMSINTLNSTTSIITTQVFQNYPIILVRENVNSTFHKVTLYSQDTLKPLYLENGWPKYLTYSYNADIAQWSDTFELLVIYSAGYFKVYSPSFGFQLTHQSQNLSYFQSSQKAILTYQPYCLIHNGGLYNFITNVYHSLNSTSGFYFNRLNLNLYVFSESKYYLVIGELKNVLCYDISYIKYSTSASTQGNVESQSDSIDFVPNLLSKTDFKKNFILAKGSTVKLSLDNNFAIINDITQIFTIWIQVPQMNTIQMLIDTYSLFDPQTNMLIILQSSTFTGYQLMVQSDADNPSSNQQESYMQYLFQIDSNGQWDLKKISGYLVFFEKYTYIYDNIQARSYMIINALTRETKTFQSVRTNQFNLMNFIWQEKDIFLTYDPAIVSYGDIIFSYIFEYQSVYFSDISENFNYIFYYNGDKTQLAHIDVSDLFPISFIRSTITNNQIIQNKNVYFNKTAVYYSYPNVYLQTSLDSPSQNIIQINEKQRIIFTITPENKQYQTQGQQYQIFDINLQYQVYSIKTLCQITFFSSNEYSTQIINPQNLSSKQNYQNFNLIESDCNIKQSKNHSVGNLLEEGEYKSGNSFYFHIQNQSNLKCIRVKLQQIGQVTQFITEELIIQQLDTNSRYKIFYVFSSQKVSTSLNVPSKQYILIQKIISDETSSPKQIEQKESMMLITVDENLQVINSTILMSDIKVTSSLFISNGEIDYLIIGTSTSILRFYALNAAQSPILISEIYLNQRQVNKLLYIPEKVQKDSARFVVITRNRIYLLKGIKILNTDSYLNKFSIVPNTFMITHSRYNIRASIINGDLLAVYNYNQVSLLRIGETFIQFIGRIEEKFFKYITQVKATSDNRIVLVSDQENIYIFQLFYSMPTPQSSVLLSSVKLPLVYQFQNIVLPQIQEIIAYQSSSQLKNNQDYGIYKIYGTSTLGLLEVTINSNTFTDKNTKYAITSYQPNITESNQQCLNLIQNNQDDLWKQRQQFQNLLTSNNSTDEKFYMIQLNKNNSQYYLPIFTENMSLYNQSKITLLIDLKGNNIEIIQTQDSKNRNALTNIQISNGTLILSKSNQINLSNFNSIIFNNLILQTDSSLENEILSQRNQITFSNTTQLTFDNVTMINGKMNFVATQSILSSLITFNNVTYINFNKFFIIKSSIINYNIINFDSCFRVIMKGITVINSNMTDLFLNFISNNKQVILQDFQILNSGINSIAKVSRTSQFSFKNGNFEGIYKFKVKSLRNLNHEKVRRLYSQDIQEYLEDFYSEQNQADFGENSKDILFKLNLIKDTTVFENLYIYKSQFTSFLNLKNIFSIQQNDSVSTTQSLVQNKSALVITAVQVDRSSFEEYFFFVNENKILFSDIHINKSTNPSIILENAISQQTFTDNQKLYFTDEYINYGVSINKFTSIGNIYDVLPILAIQKSILLLQRSQIQSNTINQEYIYPLDLNYIAFTIIDVQIEQNKCVNYFAKISNSESNMVLITNSQQNLIRNQQNQISLSSVMRQERGGIYFQNIDKLEIKSSSFRNNTGAEKGGALKLKGVNIVSLQNSTFENNRAFYSGGAIYLEDSDLIILEKTLIQQNFAYIGGGIRYNNTKIYPNFIKNINKVKQQIINNRAEIYADNYGSFINNVKLLNNLTNVTSSLNQQSINITFQLYGEDGEIVRLDNYIRLIQNQNPQMDSFSQTFSQNIFFMIKATQKEGIKLPLIYTQSNISRIVDGTSSLQFTINILDTIPSNRLKYLEILSSQSYYITNTETHEIQYKQIKLSVPIQFRDCVKGEVIKFLERDHYYCFECDSNTYSLATPDMSILGRVYDSPTCKECPNGAKYCNGNKIEIQEGYWIDPGTDYIVECLNTQEKCTQINSQQGCSEGSLGPLCESCDYNHEYWSEYPNKIYVKKNKYQCALCEELEYIFNQYTIPLVAGVIFFLYLIIRILKEHDLKIEKLKVMYLRKIEMITCSNMLYETEKSTILIKFLVSHLQLLSLISIMHVPLPQSLQTGIFFMGNLLESTYYSIDCLLIKWEMSKSVPMVYLRLLWNAVCIPLFYITGLFILFLILYLQIKKKLGNPVQRFNNLVISGMLKLYYMIFPGIISQTIKSITCRNINNVHYLVEDVQYLCYDNQYYIFNIFISIPLIIAMIIIPMIVLKKLFQARERLYNIRTFLNYSFYYSEYRSSCYYWEFIKIYIKILLYLCLNLFNQYPVIFGIIFSLVIIIYIRFQQRMKPYRYRLFNYLDNLSLTACFFTIQLYILASQKYKVFSSELPIQLLSIFMILFINIFLFIQFFKAIIDHTLQSTRKTIFQRFLIYLIQKVPCLFGSLQLAPFNFARMNKNWSLLKKNIRSPLFKKIQEEYNAKLKFISSQAYASKSTNYTLNVNRINTFTTIPEIDIDRIKKKDRIEEVKEEEDDERNNIEMQQTSLQQKVSNQINQANQEKSQEIITEFNLEIPESIENEGQTKQSLSSNPEINYQFMSPPTNEEISLTERLETGTDRELVTQGSQIDTQANLEDRIPSLRQLSYFNIPLKYNSNQFSKESIN